MNAAQQRRAIELHAKRLDKQAADAARQYDQLRAAFPTYGANDHGALMIAARHVDETARAARSFRGGDRERFFA